MEIESVKLKSDARPDIKAIVKNPPSFTKKHYTEKIIEAGHPIKVNELFNEIMELHDELVELRRDRYPDAQRYYGRRIRVLQDMAGLLNPVRHYLFHMYKVATGVIKLNLDPAHEAVYRERSHDWEMLSWALHDVKAGALDRFAFNPESVQAHTAGGKPVDVFVDLENGNMYTVGGYTTQVTVVRSNSKLRD